MTQDRMPAFMIVGAVKAATTWVAYQLRCNPALWLPKAEPHFFSTEFHRGLDWYRALFAEAPADRMVGEKSADYLAHPDAAERIAATLPGIPLVVQLRNPIDRAYSDYCMLYRRGLVNGDPRHYLDASRTTEARFLEGGRYAYHLRRLLRHVPETQLKVILYEDIREEPERVITEVCNHIGVDVHIAPEAVSDRSNDSQAPMLPLTMRRMLRSARPLLDPLRTNSVFSRARAAIARPVRYPPLTAELRAMLAHYYREDVAHLESMLGRDMSVWSEEFVAAA